MELEGVEQFSKYISHSVNDVVQKYMSSYTIYTCIISAAITLVAVIGSLIFTLRKPRRSSSEGSQPKPETSHKQDSTLKPADSTTPDANSSDDISTSGAKRDPVEYCSHIQSEMKKAQRKATAKIVQEDMTDDDRERERQVQREQLEAIFKLMQKQQEENYGIGSLDDVQNQAKLYL